MRLITLLAGYAAGLAVAMKYRKDSGISKIETDEKSKKAKVDSFIDEIVDIHKTVFSDVKDFVSTHLDDVKDFETLKSKVITLVEGFAGEAEGLIETMKNRGTEKTEEVAAEVDALFEKKSTILEAAKKKGATFTDVAYETLSNWIDEAKAKLTTSHAAIKSKIATSSEDKPAPKKKTPKTPASDE